MTNGFHAVKRGTYIRSAADSLFNDCARSTVEPIQRVDTTTLGYGLKNELFSDVCKTSSVSSMCLKVEFTVWKKIELFSNVLQTVYVRFQNDSLNRLF